MTVRRDVIQVRVTEDEKARIRELAKGAGVSPSVWVRSRALEEALGAPASAVIGSPQATASEGLAAGSERPQSAGPASPRASVYRCPKDCNPEFRPESPKARCFDCGATVVPA